MNPYSVTVRSIGIPRLEVRLIVRAESREAAGALASAIAERRHGGTFEARRVRTIADRAGLVIDAA